MKIMYPIIANYTLQEYRVSPYVSVIDIGTNEFCMFNNLYQRQLKIKCLPNIGHQIISFINKGHIKQEYIDFFYLISGDESKSTKLFFSMLECGIIE